MKISVAILFFLFTCGLLVAQQTVQSAHRFGFIENRGQVMDQNRKPNPNVEYVLSASPGLNVQLRKTGFSYDSYRSVHSQNSEAFIFSRLDAEFVDANPDVKLLSLDKNADYINYYTSGLTGSEAFRTGHFQRVIYTDLYEGIDLIFYTNPQAGIPVKYDFIIHPGADLSQVKIKYTGFNEVDFSVQELTFSMLTGKLEEKIPASWWQETGKKTDVTYRLISESEKEVVIGFLQPEMLFPGQTLVIDPEPQLDWATYYGDTLIDKGTAIMTDNHGFIYATGVTQSFTNLATSGVHQDTMAGGFTDVYITKFQNTSVRLWSTYYGGSGWDESRSLMVDTLFNISVTGFTDSPDGIASDSAYQQTLNTGTKDAFIARFNDDGLRLWSTYFGGEGDDIGNGIDADFDGFIFVTGETINSNMGIASPWAFQASPNGLSDAFLVKLDTLGFPMWSTYFGGSSDDFGRAVSEEAGAVFVTGSTQSSDLITTPGAHQTVLSGTQDAFIAGFTSSGNLTWSTFFGGSATETGNDIEIYNSKIYCTGETQSTDQIADSSAFSENLQGAQDAYVVRWDTLGTKIWSTYYGKDGEETGVGISIELDGGLYLAGNTNSDSLATAGVYDSTYDAAADIYLARIEETGAAGWCTYYGGMGDDSLTGLDVYGNTSVYLTGYTNSTDSISKTPCFQDSLAGNRDAFITRFTTYKSTIPGGVCTPAPTAVFCEGDTIQIFLVGGDLGNGANWVWYEGGCGSPAGTQIHIGDTLTVSPPVGITAYFVRAESINNATDCGFIYVEVLAAPIAEITMDDSICPGETLFLNGSGGLNYEWSGPNGFYSDLQNASIDSIEHWHAGEYVLTVDNGICADTDTATLVVMPEPVIAFTSVDPTCASGEDGSLTVHANGAGPFDYLWLESGATDSLLTDLAEGVYYVSVTDTNGCIFTDSAYVTDPALFLDGFTTVPAWCSSATGSATLITTDVNAPYTYNWSNGDTLITADSLFAGIVSVTVTNTLGCVEADTVYVDSLNNLSIDVSVLQQETCVDFNDGIAQCMVSDGTSPYTYYWSPDGGIFDTADSLAPGEYVILVTDENNCMRRDTIEIPAAVPMQLDTASLTDPGCDQNNGEIEIWMIGGTGNYSYTWSPNEDNSSYITGLYEGEYTVVVTDENGCEFSDTFLLNQPNSSEATLFSEDTIIHEGDSALIQNPAGGYSTTFPVIEWSPEVNCPYCTEVFVSPSVTQTYQLIVTSLSGCSDTAEITITVLPCIDPFIPTIFSPNNDGLNDDWLILGTCVKESLVRVYDRWGEVIFSSEDRTIGWDGTYKNENVPTGNYTYQVELKLKDGTVVSESGVITVMR